MEQCDEITPEDVSRLAERQLRFETPAMKQLDRIGKDIGYGRAIQILQEAWDASATAKGFPPRFSNARS